MKTAFSLRWKFLAWFCLNLALAGGCLFLFLRAEFRGGGDRLSDHARWLWVGGALALGSVLLWLPFIHRLTRALSQVTVDAEQIAEGRFTPPPELMRTDEIGRLNSAHRQMAARIEGLVTGQKRFLGDTAHELLSPLARLEVVLSIFEDSAGPEERTLAEGALAEVRHMAELINELLSYSKAVAGGKNIALKTVLLADITAQAVAREPKCAGLVAMDVPGALRVLIEPDLFARALSNVLRNALRYASPTSAGGGIYSFRPLRGSDGRASGPITISARNEGEGILLSVADSGPGVPAETLDRLFDPFFRPDTARTREAGGSGLGLAIVKSCIEACGGSVTARQREPHGLQLDFTLQRAD